MQSSDKFQVDEFHCLTNILAGRIAAIHPVTTVFHVSDLIKTHLVRRDPIVLSYNVNSHLKSISGKNNILWHLLSSAVAFRTLVTVAQSYRGNSAILNIIYEITYYMLTHKYCTTKTNCTEFSLQDMFSNPYTANYVQLESCMI